jgi:hypothetical protein
MIESLQDMNRILQVTVYLFTTKKEWPTMAYNGLQNLISHVSVPLICAPVRSGRSAVPS